jgi:hypothetical protein
MSSAKSGKIGLIWSYNGDEASQWIEGCKRAIKAQGFAWWDVAWKINFDNIGLPTKGYIWSTFAQKVKYVTTIEQVTILKQPEDVLAREVEKNWVEMKIPFGWNDRLHEYLRKEREVLTLLKLSEIVDLNPPLNLNELTSWKGNTILRPPQGANRIKLL